MFPKKNIELKGTAAVHLLRRQKFSMGLPFMINDFRLPKGQCYLEYPDGRIILVGLKDHHAPDFMVIRELPEKEREIVLKENNLVPAA